MMLRTFFYSASLPAFTLMVITVAASYGIS